MRIRISFGDMRKATADVYIYIRKRRGAYAASVFIYRGQFARGNTFRIPLIEPYSPGRGGEGGNAHNVYIPSIAAVATIARDKRDASVLQKRGSCLQNAKKKNARRSACNKVKRYTPMFTPFTCPRYPRDIASTLPLRIYIYIVYPLSFYLS